MSSDVFVIGAGPAGFYTAGHLLKDSEGRIEVDMLERLPTPWGLTRTQGLLDTIAIILACMTTVQGRTPRACRVCARR